jgi:hypothetical protein
MSNKKFTNAEIFIKKSAEKHCGYYLYDKVDYLNARSSVVIICPKHGDFKQIPYNHLAGKGCNKCSIERNKKRKCRLY